MDHQDSDDLPPKEKLDSHNKRTVHRSDDQANEVYQRGRYKSRGYGSRSYNKSSSGASRHSGGYISNSGHRRRTVSSTQYLTRENVQDLAHSDSQTITSCINQNESAFLTAFKSIKFCQNPIILKSLIKILSTLVSTNETQLSAPILAQVFSASGDFSQFLFQLDQLIKGMAFEQRAHIRRDDLQCLLNLWSVGIFGIEKIPKSVLHTFPRHSMNDTIVQLCSSDKNPLVRDIEQKINQLNQRFVDFLEELKHKLPQATPKVDMQEPPEHYTEVSILPTSQELHPTSKKPFLRANVTAGKYAHWEHYTDVQFRLLREDFVGPLREGIAKHCDVGSKISGDVRVYRQVTIEQPVCLASGIGFEIRFNVSQLNRVNWEYTNRLIGGSLLCLSRDNFETISFASIAQRDPKRLKEGYVVVKLEDGVHDLSIDLNSAYTMAESVAYFEAYRHVLQRLQYFSKRNEFDTLPFGKYIVECDFSNVLLPSYLRCLSKPSFDLQEILQSKRDSGKLALTNLSAWPNAKDTCLDQSQLLALQASLTQDLCVIQGPPGTGKTYIGIKIVQAFLTNRSVWDPHKKSPILVVCYTNHALDQFLEGIYQTSIHGSKPTITRIGGRSKSDILNNCLLRTKVKQVKDERLVPTDLYGKFSRARNYMAEHKKLLIQNLKLITVAKKQLLNLDMLQNVMHRDHFDQLSVGAKYELAIEVWLGLHHQHSTRMELLEEDSQQPRDETVTDEAEETADSDNEAQMLQDERLLDNYKVLYKANDLPQIPQEREANHKEDSWEMVKTKSNKKQKVIEKQLACGLKSMSKEEASTLRDLWILKREQRWELYRYWRDSCVQDLTRQHVENSHNYRYACEEFDDASKLIDCFVVQSSDVIGMTTTGAAKHNHILRSVHPKVVIVEEAAEIFEPHILTSLSASVQQLILIGDHQQLRPKPNFYELEKKYDFSVSLFERMANNGCPVVTLNIQHRMRPEIASLITPSIYAELYNDKTVEQYECIQGVGKNLFFIHHPHPETSGKDDRSHSNDFEADYSVALCEYLLKQGYKHSEITILTTYRGQLLLIKQKIKHTKSIEGVRIAVVDDFQGEENNIIILSLVRSNSDGVIGFLRVKNRVCVALSRAKKGFYVVGNFSMLEDKDSTIWPDIISHLKIQKCIGEALPLHCQLHPDEVVLAKLPADFQKCPEGGCQKNCDTRLVCGHVCKRLCHPYDRDHVKYRCFEKCGKLLPCGHSCLYKCYECTKSCRPCSTKVLRVLPLCGHSQQVSCSIQLFAIQCSRQCVRVLECGHLCQEACSMPCTDECMVPVKKSLTCGHTATAPCHITTDSIVCGIPCNSNLDCSHQCTGTCGTCYAGRLHIECVSKCDRLLMCGHLCDFPCTPMCPPCLKPCTNFCNHSRCPKKCFEPCTPCIEPCQWSCKHYKCTQPCGSPCNRPPCNYPCRKRLICGHECIGLCGEICPQKCRICDKEVVCQILFGNEDEPDARFIYLPDCQHHIEVNSLDQWMFEKDSSSNPQEVNLKACPLCKTPVQKCYRYGNVIKDYLYDVDMIKRKQLEALPSFDLKTELRKVERALRKSSNFNYVMKELENVEKAINRQCHPTSTREGVVNLLFPHVLKAQLTILSQVVQIMDIVLNRPTPPVSCTNSIEKVKQSLDSLKTFISQDFLSQQQISDGEAEGLRLLLLAKLIDFKCKIHIKQCTLAASELDGIDSTMQELIEQTSARVSQSYEESTLRLLSELSTKYSIDGLTKAERNEIIKAVGLRQGHWFKCPNGHYYCIGECGGAMETAICPDCGTQIGGTNHALLQSNQHAPEMDGARHAAWSNMANLRNFDLQDL